MHIKDGSIPTSYFVFLFIYCSTKLLEFAHQPFTALSMCLTVWNARPKVTLCLYIGVSTISIEFWCHNVFLFNFSLFGSLVAVSTSY